MAQSVQRLTSAQVMISQSVGLSPISDSVLTAQRLEPASDTVSPSLSAPPPPLSLSLCLSLSLSLSKINKHLKKTFKIQAITDSVVEKRCTIAPAYFVFLP